MSAKVIGNNRKTVDAILVAQSLAGKASESLTTEILRILAHLEEGVDPADATALTADYVAADAVVAAAFAAADVPLTKAKNLGMRVIAAGIHPWAGGAAVADSIAVAGLLATDVVVASLAAQGAAEVLVTAVANETTHAIDLTLSYEESSQAIKQIVGGDRAKAEKLAQLVGIFSPQTPVAANWDNAVRAYLRWDSGANREEFMKTALPSGAPERVQHAPEGPAGAPIANSRAPIGYLLSAIGYAPRAVQRRSRRSPRRGSMNFLRRRPGRRASRRRRAPTRSPWRRARRPPPPAGRRTIPPSRCRSASR